MFYLHGWHGPALYFWTLLSLCCICSSSGVCFRLDFKLKKDFFYKGCMLNAKQTISLGPESFDFFVLSVALVSHLLSQRIFY